jgi:hypothetical protein
MASHTISGNVLARSAKNLRKERELYDIYTAYAESEARSA